MFVKFFPPPPFSRVSLTVQLIVALKFRVVPALCLFAGKKVAEDNEAMIALCQTIAPPLPPLLLLLLLLLLIPAFKYDTSAINQTH